MMTPVNTDSVLALFRRVGALLSARKEELADLMTREMGKPLAETRGDVQEAIDMTYFLAAEGRRLHGQTAPSELRDKFAMSLRQPIGVCSMITPWNFPMAIPSWKIIPALVCGNTVVLKPSELTPLSSVNFVKVLEEAGVPAGVVNLVVGGPAVGEILTTHPDVSVVSFTGSTAVGKLVLAFGSGRETEIPERLDAFTPRTITDPEELAAAGAEIRGWVEAQPFPADLEQAIRDARKLLEVKGLDVSILTSGNHTLEVRDITGKQLASRKGQGFTHYTFNELRNPGLIAGLAAELRIAKDGSAETKRIRMERDAALNLNVSTIEFLSPTTRLSGRGRITHVAGKGFEQWPLQFEFRLAGKGYLQQLLNEARVLSGQVDDKGYATMGDAFTVGGTAGAVLVAALQLPSADALTAEEFDAAMPSSVREVLSGYASTQGDEEVAAACLREARDHRVCAQPIAVRLDRRAAGADDSALAPQIGSDPDPLSITVVRFVLVTLGLAVSAAPLRATS